MRKLISIVLSLLLTFNSIFNINNEYIVPKTWQSLFKLEGSNKDRDIKRRKK